MTWRANLLASLATRNCHEQDSSNIAQCHAEILRRYNTLRKDNATLSVDLEKERDTASHLRDDLEKLEQRYGAAKQNTRIMELEATNKSLQQQLQRAFDGSQRLIKLQDAEQTLTARVAQLEAECQTLKSTVTNLEMQNNSLNKDLTATKHSEELLRADRNSFTEKMDSVTKESVRLTEEIIKSKTQVAALMNQNLELDTKICELTAEIERLRSQLPTQPSHRDPNNNSIGEMPRASLGFLDDRALGGYRGAYATVPLGRKVRDIEEAHAGDINAVVFASSADRLATGGNDKCLKLWDIHSGELVTALTATGSILAAAYVNDMIVAGCADNVARVYNVSTQRSRFQLTGHNDSVTTVAVSQDGTRAYTGSKDRTLKQWDIKERGAFLWTRPCFSLCHDITCANDVVITAHFDAVVRVWDSRQGSVTGEIKNAHAQSLTCVRFNPTNRNQFLTLGRDSTLKLWDTRQFETLATFTAPELSVSSNFCRAAWSDCGSYIAVGGTNHVLVFSGSKQGPPCIVLKGSHRGQVNSVCWTADGRMVCSVGADRRMIFWS